MFKKTIGDKFVFVCNIHTAKWFGVDERPANSDLTRESVSWYHLWLCSDDLVTDASPPSRSESEAETSELLGLTGVTSPAPSTETTKFR